MLNVAWDKHVRKVSLAWLLLTQATLSSAQQDIAQTPEVPVVTVKSENSDQSREFVAGKIILDRRQIEASGTQNVAELLKRQSTITVSGDGRIGLHGMPGYTQILVDGTPPGTGKSLAEINLLQVEKIEIIKSSVAEYGPYGIAGTINVVMRQTRPVNRTQGSAGWTTVGGLDGGNLGLSISRGSPMSPLQLGLQLSARKMVALQEEVGERTLITNSETTLQDSFQQRVVQSTRMYSASGTVQMALSAKNVFRFAPSIGRTTSAEGSQSARRWESGESLVQPASSSTRLDMVSLPFTWTMKPQAKTSVEVYWLTNLLALDTGIDRTDVFSSGANDRRVFGEQDKSAAHNLKLTVKKSFPGGHELKAGAGLVRAHQKAQLSSTLNGSKDETLGFLGLDRDLRRHQRRAFLQDDWRVNKNWTVNGGIVGEDTVIDFREQANDVAARFRVWSPSLHVAKKIDSQRRLKVSLARSFRAPDDDQLTARPTIHPLAPCVSAGSCVPNTVDTADNGGNPLLLPERSVGLSLTYEHSFGDDSQITLEAFAKRIQGKIGREIVLTPLPWSPQPRFLERPANLGEARVRGIDIGMDLALTDLWQDGPRIAIRSALEVATSTVSSIPGPDNRIDKQTPWSAKIGGTHTFKAAPVKLDVDFNWTPGTWTALSATRRLYIPRRNEWSVNANWTAAPSVNLIAGLSGSMTRSDERLSDYRTAAGLLRVRTLPSTHTTFTFRLEGAW